MSSLTSVEFAIFDRQPTTRRGAAPASILNFDPPEEEFPVGWDPETDPYPESAFNVIIDQALSNIETVANPTLDEAAFLLTDPYSDDIEDDEDLIGASDLQLRTPIKVKFVRAAFSLDNFLSDDPCEDQKDDVDTQVVIVGLAVIGALAAIVALPVTAPAVVVGAAIAGAYTGVGATLVSLNNDNRKLARCKSRNPWYYPRRP